MILRLPTEEDSKMLKSKNALPQAQAQHSSQWGEGLVRYRVVKLFQTGSEAVDSMMPMFSITLFATASPASSNTAPTIASMVADLLSLETIPPWKGLTLIHCVRPMLSQRASSRRRLASSATRLVACPADYQLAEAHRHCRFVLRYL